MIDNYKKTMELIEQMKAQLPIPVYPGNAFIQMMREQGIRTKSKQRLQIEQVLYDGDEGGIMCGLGRLGERNEVFVCSLTHLRVKEGHPLANAMETYQRERKKKLVQQGSFRLSLTVIPPKRREERA